MRTPGTLILASALAFVVAAPAASAASLTTPFAPSATPNPEPQAGARWGERLVSVNDENGDGVNDFFMATPFADLSFPNQGRVYLMSGSTRAILRVIDAPEPQGGTAFGFSATGGASFGFYISSPGDIDGDGKDDIVAGTDAQNVYTGSGAPCGASEPNGCNEGQGRAWAFSGATGAVLRTFDNPDPQGAPGNRARFGSRIGRAGDVTGDGVPDIIIGASENDIPAGCANVSVGAGCRKNQGQAYIFNGATGALVRTLDMPTADRSTAPCSASCGSFGIAVQGPGDTDGDGVADQLVDAGSYSYDTGTGTACGTPEPNGCNESQGRMYVFSGATGALLQRFDDPIPQANATFGFQDAAPLAPGDVNGDGKADVFANGFGQAGPTGEGEGRAWVFNGATGALLYTLPDPTPEKGGQFGWSLAGTDYNGDATPDLYVGQSPHHVEGSIESGGTYVFDGRDGSVLKALELPPGDVQPGTTGNVGPALGWGLAAPGDLNGDGNPDYLAGAPFVDEGGLQDNGRIYAFMSGTPTTPPGLTPPTKIIPTTLPRVKVAGLTAHVRPTRDRRAPYTFTVTGAVKRPAGIGPSACKGGRVSAQWKTIAGKTVSTRRATLSSSCTYRIRVTFANRRRLGSGRLKVIVRFLGTARLERRSAGSRLARAG